MKGFYFALVMIGLVAVSSCTKKVGSMKACFTFSKNPAKVNDTIYLLNCSENYSKFYWIIPGSNIDSINKHNYVVPTSTGITPVGLLIWSLDGKDTTGLVQTLTVQ